MSYTPLQVANFFIRRARMENKPVDHLKLQKLVYIAHGWYLGLFPDQEPLVDEVPEAWPYGPVFQSLYWQLQGLGRAQIVQEVESVYGQLEPIEETALAGKFLERIWRLYGDLSAGKLVTLTHQAGTPWSMIRDACESEPRGIQIPNESTREFYRRRVEARTSKQADVTT